MQSYVFRKYSKTSTLLDTEVETENEDDKSEMKQLNKEMVS